MRGVLARPRPLEPGARVALLAAAGPVAEERLNRAHALCESLGLRAHSMPTATARLGFLAGSDEARLRDLQGALDDPAVDAVWALRGGYGSMRVLDRLDFARMRQRPKPFIGFSDNTAVLIALHAAGVMGFHGPHPGGDFPAETAAAFKSVLFGEHPSTLPLRDSDPLPRTLRGGSADGPLLGGNLALLAALCGTRFAPDTRGAILFMEDVGEPVYRIDRLLTQLRLAGLFDGIAALAFGRFTEMEDEHDDRTLEHVLQETANRIGVPAVVDLPIGHVPHNWTVPIGVRARLDADRASLTLLEPAVTTERP